jgi:hypothetical protein
MKLNEVKQLIREMLLLEARIDRVAARYPEIGDMILSDLQDVPGKFIDWAAKQLSQEPTPDIASKLVTLTQQFEDLAKRNRVKQKDISAYKTLGDLESTVKQALQKKSARQQRIAKKADSRVFLDDENYFIVVPESQGASCYYGKGTKWCISATKSQNQWDYYAEETGFVFVFSKQELPPEHANQKKFALAIDEDGEVYEAYDAEDELFDADLIIFNLRQKGAKASQAINDAIEYASKIPKQVRSEKLKKVRKEALRVARELGVPDHHVQIDESSATSQDPMVIIGDPARGDYDTGWYVELFPDGRRNFYFNGKRHRDDGPAEITRTKKKWYQHGKLHRDGAPAQVSYLDDNYQVLNMEMWYQRGKLHRDDGPAKLVYSSDGSVYRERWFEDGYLHREDGPALITYDKHAT